MLAVVAVLFVIVMTSVLGTDDGGKKKANGSGSLDGAITSPDVKSSSADKTPSTTTSSSHSSAASPAGSSGPSGTGKPGSCPTAKTCVLDGDIGNGVAAINAYRTQHGQSAITGGVSDKAQTCAMHNGNGCSGAWAESQVSKPDGTNAVKKILQFGHLLDPKIKTIEVGWAYDPGAKQYYFAIIRKY
jgi:hypothetical protein